MNPQLITLLVLIIAFIFFLLDRFPPEAIALGVMVVLGLSGVLTIPEALAGFGNSTVVTLMAIFILAKGLQQAGWTDRIAGWVLRVGGMTEIRLIVVVMASSALLSLFMNNVAAAAVLLPAVVSAASQARLKPSRLLMPMAIGTLLGGASTLFTTTNLVSSGLLKDNGLKGFGMLDFLPIGLVLLICGIIYMVWYGRNKLPEGGLNTWAPGRVMQNLMKTYQLAERMVQVRIMKGSPLAGKSLMECGLRQDLKLSLVMINRNGLLFRLPAPDVILFSDDILVMEGRHDLVDWKSLTGILEVLPERKLDLKVLQSEEAMVMEAVLAPRSNLVGQTIKDSKIREKFGVQVLGIWRAGKPIRSELENRILQVGDGLLLYGKPEKIDLLREDPDLILLRNSDLEQGHARKYSWPALAIFIGTILFAIIFTDFLSLIIWAGALLMILVGILSMEQAYRAIEWKTVFLVAGMLPLGTAILKTGLADQAVTLLTPLANQTNPYFAFILLYILTLFLSQVIHGAVVATIMVPIGIQLAISTGMNPRAVVMGLALATSLTFITPLGHPVSMLIMAPGEYRVRDYIRVGLPLAVMLSLVVLLVLPVFWQINP